MSSWIHFKRPELRVLVGKREKIEFAQTVDEYSRRYKVKLKILKSRLFSVVPLILG